MSRPRKYVQHVDVHMPDDMHAWLLAESGRTGSALAQLVREAIVLFRKRETVRQSEVDRLIRAGRKADADAAADEAYQLPEKRHG